MASLTLKSISKKFGATSVLEDVSLQVADGEFLVLVGPSGCGKSTLLRIVAGLVEPDGGDVVLGATSLLGREPRERDVAMVFQNYALYPHMTVRRNLGFPLKMARVPAAEAARRVEEVAATLGLTSMLGRKPATLSGGQMQRVAVGRAIVRNPRIFLFDEPLSNLDAKLRSEMRSEIARLHRRLGITTLYVTHDQAEAMTMGDRIAVLNGGRLEQVGPPLEVFERPATTFVASFIGSPPMNLVPGRVAGGRFTRGELSLPCPVIGRDEVVLGLRPHEIASGRAVTLEVRHVEQLGTGTHVECDLDGDLLRVSFPGRREVRAGEKLGIELAPETLHWFGADGRRLA